MQTKDPAIADRVAYVKGNCMIEVDTEPGESAHTKYVARMSVIEENGAIVRPLVGMDGARIKIHASTERLVLRVAVSYLESRFGRSLPLEKASSLGDATVGAPFVAS